jgi:hypothetical protein
MQKQRNKLRTCNQRAADNIPDDEIEHLSCVFLLPPTTEEEEKLISIFPTQNQSISA